MAIKLLTEIGDQLALEVPRCPLPYINAALRRVSVDFLRDSEVWRKTLAAINQVAAQAAYKLDPAEGTAGTVDIWRILEATDSDAPIDADHYMLDYKAVLTVYDYYLEFLTDYIPTVSSTGTLEVTVALTPSAASTGYIDPFIVNQWSNAFYEGTLALLYSLPSRSWFNPGEAAVHQGLYNAQLALARKERTQQFTTDGELRATNPEGWL